MLIIFSKAVSICQELTRLREDTSQDPSTLVSDRETPYRRLRKIGQGSMVIPGHNLDSAREAW